MVNTWIEKLKVFNKDVNVWAIPRKETAERKLLDEGKQFRYTLALHGSPVSKLMYVKPAGGKEMTIEEKVKRIKEPKKDAKKEAKKGTKDIREYMTKKIEEKTA